MRSIHRFAVLAAALTLMTSALALPATAAPLDITPKNPVVYVGVPAAGAGLGAAAARHAWLGGSAGHVLGTTALGGATAGGIIGIGVVAGLDAVMQPCAGLHALLGMNRGSCRNGQ